MPTCFYELLCNITWHVMMQKLECKKFHPHFFAGWNRKHKNFFLDNTTVSRLRVTFCTLPLQCNAVVHNAGHTRPITVFLSGPWWLREMRQKYDIQKYVPFRFIYCLAPFWILSFFKWNMPEHIASYLGKTSNALVYKSTLFVCSFRH